MEEICDSPVPRTGDGTGRGASRSTRRTSRFTYRNPRSTARRLPGLGRHCLRTKSIRFDYGSSFPIRYQHLRPIALKQTERPSIRTAQYRTACRSRDFAQQMQMVDGMLKTLEADPLRRGGFNASLLLRCNGRSIPSLLEIAICSVATGTEPSLAVRGLTEGHQVASSRQHHSTTYELTSTQQIFVSLFRIQ